MTRGTPPPRDPYPARRKSDFTKQALELVSGSSEAQLDEIATALETAYELGRAEFEEWREENGRRVHCGCDRAACREGHLTY